MQFGPLILVFAALLLFLAVWFGALAGVAKVNYNGAASALCWVLAALFGCASLAASTWAGALLAVS